MGQKTKTKQSFDAIISGGGMIGLPLAIGLSRCGMKVAVIDATTPKTQLDKTFDGRSSAIAYASYLMLDAIGLWQHAAKFAQPINDIHVSDAGTFVFVHFETGDHDHNPMGFMVENRHIRLSLEECLKETKGVTRFAPNKIKTHKKSAGGVSVTLEDGPDLSAPLLIAAEGRFSSLRKSAGIGVTNWSYKQSGIVATIEHEHAHLGIAHELFFGDGPFAILPLQGNRSSLVWALKDDYANLVKDFSDAAFEREISERVGGFLGKVKVTGPRWVFPLSLQMPDSIIGERLVLTGDAAHGIHPIAGQGLNLGFRDIAALIEVLNSAKSNGEDLGGVQVLERYERWRRTDNLVLATVTDGLTKLFSNDLKAVKAARAFGLGVVQKTPKAKKFFVDHARGTFGKLPVLLKGELPKT